MKVCAVCGSAVRKSGKKWFHKSGGPFLGTIAREVTNEQYAKNAGVRPERIAPSKSHMVESVEGV